MDTSSPPSSSFGEDQDFLQALATSDLIPKHSGQTARSDGHDDSDMQVIQIKARDELPTSSSSSKQATLDFSYTTYARQKKREAPSDDHVIDIEEAISKRDGKHAYMAGEQYKPVGFGDIGQYLRNKRAKLKVQESSLAEDEATFQQAKGSAQSESGPPQIFAGTVIYINGHTDPPHAELRRLLLLHGGELLIYLDVKSPVTHIIASNLTPKKRIEFKDYRVVRPEWVTQSIQRQKRLDWRLFKCGADAPGAMQWGAIPQTNRDQSQQHRFASASASSTAAVSAKGDWRQAALVAQGQAPVPNATATGSASGSHYTASGQGLRPGAKTWGSAASQKTLMGWAAPAPTKDQLERESSGRDEKGSSQKLHSQASDPTEESRESETQDKGEPAQTVDGETTATAAAAPPPATSAQTLTPRSKRWLDQVSTPPRTRSDGPSTELPSDPVTGIASGPMTTAAPTPQKDKGSTEAPQKDKAAATTPASKAATPQASKAQAESTKPAWHGYANRPSNVSAARLLASPSWRERNTATSDSFLAGYFEKSRLHHLSTWKSEMQEMVGQAMIDSGRSQGSQDLPSGVRRVIMHVDFDSFFVAVGLRDKPVEFRLKPIVVCHGSSDDGNAPASSTSEIASCNYVARGYGIRNGMSLGQARRLCSTVQSIPYDFAGYNEVSIQFYSILLAHADALEAVSVDEALIDVSLLLDRLRKGEDVLDEDGIGLLSAYQGHVSSQGQAWTEERQLAEALRDKIRGRTGCEASIGIGANVLQARLATRKAKPGGSFHLQLENVVSFTAELDVDDLHGIGWSMRGRLKELFGTFNVGELRNATSEARLVAELGPLRGKTVWDKLHGRERDRLEGARQRQSLGAAVNYAIRFANEAEAENFVQRLCQEVSRRLKAAGLRGRQVAINIMVRTPTAPIEAPKFLGHGPCDTFHKSASLRGPGGAAVEDGDAIFRAAWPLLKGLRADPTQLRGIGVSLQKLEPANGKPPTIKAPEPGQQTLAFSRKIATPKPIQAGPKSPQQEKQVVRDVDDEPSLTPGPSGATPRRRSPSPSSFKAEKPDLSPTRPQMPTAAATATSPLVSRDPPTHRTAVPLPDALAGLGTQFAIPSPSQLDPDVVAALPPRIQAQISAAQKSVTGSHLSCQGPEPREEVTKTTEASASLVAPAPAINPVPRRSTFADRTRGGSAPISRPTAAEPLVLPSLSQFDPEVLEALPEDIRLEVLREAEIQSRTRAGSSKRGAQALGRGVGTSIAQGIVTSKRSASVSPSKRSRTSVSGGGGGGGVGNLMAPPLVPAPRLAADQPSFRAALLASDPSSLSDSDLTSLRIDVETFRSLPLEIQRDLLFSRSREVETMRNLFKGGRHVEEMSLVEERRMNTQKAGLENLFARRAKEEDEELGRTPSIRGQSSVEEVRGLLSAWYQRFKVSGPRPGDVARFGSFLTNCVAQEGRVGAPSLDLEKARLVLMWWSGLIGEEEEEQGAAAGWKRAYEEVVAEVQKAVKRRFGAILKL